MCGICGSFNRGKVDISGMLRVLEHRGGNGQGSYSDNFCSLGHCRLAILDLSPTGKQPMSNEDGTIQMVVNGEIYNYKELRNQLISNGHIFKSNCDSEVIVHAYEQYGHGFVNRLRGMFSIALYDKNNNELVIARDPIGKKPLYYYQKGDEVVFASEIKALFQVGVPCEINYDMLPSYLMYQYTMGEETLFKGVKKLLAGHIKIFTLRNVITHQYFILNDKNRNDGFKVRQLLEQSVKLRLQSDVPVGSFLSGGIDSSLVTALYRKFYSGDLHTFTASFQNKSEAKYAKIVSRCLETKYHEVLITSDMVAKDLDKITWFYDEPLGEAATINNFYLAQEAKKYVTVVLAGEGGDEVFGGYPWYNYAKYIKLFNLIPSEFRLLGQFIPILLNGGDMVSKTNKISRILMFPCQEKIEKLILYPETTMSDNNLYWLLNREYSKDWKVWPIVPEQVKDTYNRMLAMDCLNLLAEKYLMKADKGTMAYAIEERLPLLDKEIIEYAFSIPTEFKKDKFILRKAVEDLLPQEIVWRKKQGFGTPLSEWLSSSQLKDRVIDRLKYGELLKDICKPKSLDKLTSYFINNQSSESVMSLSPMNNIWSLFALQTWFDLWFKDKRCEY